MSVGIDEPIEMLAKVTRDLRNASRLLTRDEARYLVDLYYQVQGFRIRAGGQVFHQPTEPNAFLEWVNQSMGAVERNIKNALGTFAKEYRVGSWLQDICGIGPVISAGLLSIIDIRRARTVGHIWSFAGLSPDKKWEKGKKRPYCAQLKTLCAFKIGESFVKVQNNEADFYGKLFRAYKDGLVAMNERGKFADAAKGALEVKRFGRETQARQHYEQGHLPPAHIHARARRWTVKLFLSHVHHAMFDDYFGRPPSDPYCFEKQPEIDHREYIAPPNWPGDYKGKAMRELLGEPS